MENTIDKLQLQINKLRDDNHFKTEWLSRVSHDLKETFGSILWLTEAVEEGTINRDDFFKLVPRIKDDAKKNLKTLEDTSEWLKIRNTEFKLNPSAIKVFQLFQDLEKSFYKELTLKNIQLQFEGDKNLSFTADPFLTYLLLKKVLHNAIKFSHSNCSIVFAANKDLNKTMLTIADKGIGMSEEHLNTCFSFMSARFQGTSGEYGAGLGLKIAQEIVYLLQGKIKLESQENEGTTVFIFLP